MQRPNAASKLGHILGPSTVMRLVRNLLAIPLSLNLVLAVATLVTATLLVFILLEAGEGFMR